MATVRHVFKSDMALNGVLTVMKKNALLGNVRYNNPSLSLHDIRPQCLARGPFFAVRLCIFNVFSTV